MTRPLCTRGRTPARRLAWKLTTATLCLVLGGAVGCTEPTNEPDLTPTQVAGPATGVAGQTAQVTVTVQNIGRAKAPSGWSAEIRLSSDQVCLSSAVDPNTLAYTQTTDLDPGASTSATQTATIPSSIAPGTYYWCVVVDPAGGTVSESNENNNTLIGNQITISSSAAPLVPLVWYPFSGNATDSMGTGYDGTVTGATLTADRHGAANRAYSFNGSSDFISFGQPSAFDLAGPTSTWSAAVWLRYTQGDGLVLSKMDAGTNGWNITVMADGRITGRLDGGSTNSFNMATTTSYMDGDWHLVYVRWNAAAATAAEAIDIWVDGVQQTTTQSAGVYYASQDYNTVSDLTVAHGVGSNTWFAGDVDEVRLYAGALSAAEIQAMYAAER
jgi:hypothetical protein